MPPRSKAIHNVQSEPSQKLSETASSLDPLLHSTADGNCAAVGGSSRLLLSIMVEGDHLTAGMLLLLHGAVPGLLLISLAI